MAEAGERGHLARVLALAYGALIIYASLHPFGGWRDPGLPPLYFLEASWPRYWTGFDLVINVLAYLPFGFFCETALRRHAGPTVALVVAFLLGSTLSLSLECLQAWLPSRVASNLDLATNAIGTLCGAGLAHRWGPGLLGRLSALQRYLREPGPRSDVGLLLVGLWLLTQLSPETILFGAGDLRALLGIPPALAYAAHSFFAMETGVIVCNTVAIGLLVSTLVAGGRRPVLPLAVFFLAALGIRSLAAAILVGPLTAFAWLTPGAAFGLMVGGGILSLALLLPPNWRVALAGAALMAGAVLVNLVPPNPYSALALASWRQGHFLNFNGLTRLAASLWPFLALPYLTLLGRRLP